MRLDDALIEVWQPLRDFRGYWAVSKRYRMHNVFYASTLSDQVALEICHYYQESTPLS